MNPNINFQPERNYGQPNFGCSKEQFQNHQNMCNFINKQRGFQTISNYYHSFPHRSYQRPYVKAIRVQVALNKGQNHWMENIVNF